MEPLVLVLISLIDEFCSYIYMLWLVTKYGLTYYVCQTNTYSIIYIYEFIANVTI